MKYRKKPVIIDAIQWTGKNIKEIKDFCPTVIDIPPAPIEIPTLEGNHTALINDFIIRGIHGEFYPCKPDIFEKTYELVEESAMDGAMAEQPTTGEGQN